MSDEELKEEQKEKKKINWHQFAEDLKGILQIGGLILLLIFGFVILIFRKKIFGEDIHLGNILNAHDVDIQHDPNETDEVPDTHTESDTSDYEGGHPNASEAIASFRDRLNSIADKYGLRRN